MIKMISVSILIPVYNVRDFVIRCLQSVESQTYAGPLECIVIDDCGNDGSMSLVEKFIADYNGHINFRIIHHKYNRGLAAARNTAVADAKGDFVFHLDSDDWLEPTAIEHLVLKQQETDADIVSGQALKHTQYGTSILKDPEYKLPRDMVNSMIEKTIVHVIWRRLIRRTLYTDNDIKTVEGVNVGEDYCTIPKLAYFAKKVSTLDEIVYHYNCLNPNSYMAEHSPKYNVKRFRSDLSSIMILQEFFSDKDDYCVNRLNEIRTAFLKQSLREAAFVNDKNAFYEILAETSGYPHLFVYWKYSALLLKIIGKVQHILTGNV